MGAFLAALGAVLLFILRVIGILLLVVLILLVLLLLCPFCADLCWEHGVLTVKAGALGITFPVFQYPKPEPPPAPENPEPPRGFGKVKAKFAAWRAERKRKKAEEKARKKAAAAAAKANKPAQPRKKAKITLEILCTMLKGAGTLTKAVFGARRSEKAAGCRCPGAGQRADPLRHEEGTQGLQLRIQLCLQLQLCLRKTEG